MKVRELIAALQKHDRELEVVIASARGAPTDLSGVAMVYADVVVSDPRVPGALRLAHEEDLGADVVVRLGCSGEGLTRDVRPQA